MVGKSGSPIKLVQIARSIIKISKEVQWGDDDSDLEKVSLMRRCSLPCIHFIGLIRMISTDEKNAYRAGILMIKLGQSTCWSDGYLSKSATSALTAGTFWHRIR